MDGFVAIPENWFCAARQEVPFNFSQRPPNNPAAARVRILAEGSYCKAYGPIASPCDWFARTAAARGHAGPLAIDRFPAPMEAIDAAYQVISGNTKPIRRQPNFQSPLTARTGAGCQPVQKSLGPQMSTDKRR